MTTDELAAALREAIDGLEYEDETEREALWEKLTADGSVLARYEARDDH